MFLLPLESLQTSGLLVGLVARAMQLLALGNVGSVASERRWSVRDEPACRLRRIYLA